LDIVRHEREEANATTISRGEDDIGGIRVVQVEADADNASEVVIESLNV
jgi:hypothetical protein